MTIQKIDLTPASSKSSLPHRLRPILLPDRNKLRLSVSVGEALIEGAENASVVVLEGDLFTMRLYRRAAKPVADLEPRMRSEEPEVRDHAAGVALDYMVEQLSGTQFIAALETVQARAFKLGAQEGRPEAP